MIRTSLASTILCGLLPLLVGAAPAESLVSRSAKAPVGELQSLGPADADQAVSFQVYLPLRNSDDLNALIEQQHTPGSPSFHHWLTPMEFRARYGASPEKLEQAKNLIEAYGLTVANTHSHGLQVTGKVSDAEALIGARIHNAVAPNGMRTVMSPDPVTLPSALSGLGAKVVHFSPRIHMHKNSRVVATSPDNRYSPTGGYWFTDMKQAYEFPSYQVLNGKGVTIGIVVSNDFLDSDMVAYFAHENLPAPRIFRRPVLGGAPFEKDASDEVSLDLQQAGGMAPAATLIHYNLPDLSDPSILEGYLDVVDDNLVDIVNSSFSGPEALYSPEYNGGTDYFGILDIYQQIFQQGNAQGITFVASSGDDGALIPPVNYFYVAPKKPPVVVGSFVPGVQFPASSPNVTAVGGTNLVTTYTKGSLTSDYVRENAFGDALLPYDPYGFGSLLKGGYWGSGGGESMYFAKPLYQRLIQTGTANRSVPDVSLHMGGCPFGTIATNCPADRSFVWTRVGGKYVGLIGTSISSPEFAGLLALKEEYLQSRMGNENNDLYILSISQQFGLVPRQIFRQNIPGYNGFFESTPGYNQVVGLGTPFGAGFITAAPLPLAGDPKTPSNP